MDILDNCLTKVLNHEQLAFGNYYKALQRTTNCCPVLCMVIAT